MILLCTDGLSNILSAEEISDILQNSEFFSSAEALVKRALDEGAYDNVTAMVFKS